MKIERFVNVYDTIEININVCILINNYIKNNKDINRKR